MPDGNAQTSSSFLNSFLACVVHLLMINYTVISLSNCQLKETATGSIQAECFKATVHGPALKQRAARGRQWENSGNNIKKKY